MGWILKPSGELKLQLDFAVGFLYLITMTNELLAHLAEIRRKTEAWVAEDPTNRWATIPTEDLEHWEKLGITTVAQYKHYNLVCTAYEMTRSAFGYKPSWVHLTEMSSEDLQKEIDFLAEECKRQIEAEKREEEAERQEQIAHEAIVKEAMKTRSGFTIGERTGMDLVDKGTHYEMVLG